MKTPRFLSIRQSFGWLLCTLLLTAGNLESRAQCPTDLLTGQNLVKNPDFSGGYTDWTFTADPNRVTGYQVFNPPLTQNFSSPGFIYASTDPQTFNSAFGTFPDHSPSSDNMMLMVDGICAPGIKLWSQPGIPVTPNTNYYFSVFIHALKDNNNPPGSLMFDVNGVNLTATPITAPTSIATGWIKFETVWFSGPSPTTPATISIENTTTVGCDQFVDFAIDDISFIPGCAYGAPGPQPNLGPDRTLCGTGGSLTIDAGVPHTSGTTVSWSSNAPPPLSGSGASAPYTKSISTPGTYSVCVTENGSCVKADVVVISNTYSVELGGPYNLCNPISQLLDAQHSGTGVTYQWYKESNGVAGWQPADTIPQARSRTYTATSPGTYRVVVNDVMCGQKEDVAIVTTSATATPKDVYYCNKPTAKAVTLSVTGTGSFNWFSSPTGGSPLNATPGNTYTTPPISTDMTYYVEDATVYTTTVGKPSLPANSTSRSQTQISDKYMIFDAKQPLTIDSVTVYMWLNNFNPSDPISIQFRLTDNPVNYNTTPAALSSGPLFSMTNTTANAAGLISPPWPTKADNIYAVKVPVKINVPSAGSYRLTVASQNPTNTQIETAGASYPYNDVATGGKIISVTGSKLQNNIPTLTEYHGMYNWQIKYLTPCGRVPVRAIVSCPLPVEFIDFKAESSPEEVLLTWTTAWEKNNDHFLVQRSADGIVFETMSEVKGKGTTSSASSYLFIDHRPLPGNAFYRIVQVDREGSTSSSEIKAISSFRKEIGIAPNPGEGIFRLTISGSDNDEATIIVRNSLGQAVYEGSARNNSEKELNLNHVPDGVYYVQVADDDEISVIKIIKE